jgi:hypothetical protein
VTKRYAILIPILLAAALAGGCSARDADDDFEFRLPETVVIHVRNQNTQQATVFIREDGEMRARLGEVAPLSDRFFERALFAPRSIRFDIRMLAGRTYETHAIAATPGDTIQVTVPSRF